MSTESADKPRIVEARIPSGFTEYLPAEQIEFNRLLNIIRSTYESHGFLPLDTPVMELSEVLLVKSGGDTEKQVYRFTKGRNDLSLRFDLTVPLARYVAMHENDLTFPFSRYQIGKVYRGERAQRGRSREFYQCDIDTIGSSSPIIDAQFPAIINDIFEQFNFGEFTIRMNNRLVLNGFFAAIGLESKSGDVLRLVDSMEKISSGELVKQLTELGLTAEQVDQVLDFTTIVGTNDEVLTQLKELGIDSPQFNDGVTKLETLVQTLRLMNVPESRFKVDLKIARGLDYYTGTVYETLLDEYPEIGSVCSGGRYDNLAEYYTKTQLPGVGISIGLTRLFYQLREIGVIKPGRQTPADVVVMPLTADQTELALQVAGRLRIAGVATMLYSEENDFKRKMRYADRMQFGFVVLIGQSEVKSGMLSVKNMATGTTTPIALADLAEHIQS